MLNVIADALSNPDVRERIRNDLLNREGTARPTDNVTFVVEGHEPAILVESTAWHGWYGRFRATLTKNSSGRSMISVASGEPVTPIKTHGPVTGLASVGGIAMGDSLASFKQDAFRHFGLEQAENAALSAAEAAAYRAALDGLIRDRSRNLAGARIAYWYMGPGVATLASEDPIREYLLPFTGGNIGEDDEDAMEAPELSPKEQAELARTAGAQAADRVRKLLEAVRAGERPELVQTRFYALSLSANSGRVVIRDWMQGDFADLAGSILRWADDLRIVRLDSPNPPDQVPRLEAL
jgi:CRISPR-associated protein Csd1